MVTTDKLDSFPELYHTLMMGHDIRNSNKNSPLGKGDIVNKIHILPIIANTYNKVIHLSFKYK